MAGSCVALTEEGARCGAPAVLLDAQRNGPVCLYHAPVHQPPAWVQPSRGPGWYIQVRFRGDQLAPLIRDGDQLLIHTGSRPLAGDHVCVLVRDTLIVRRLEWQRAGWVLTTTDGDILPVDDSTGLIGRVVGLCHPLTGDGVPHRLDES